MATCMLLEGEDSLIPPHEHTMVSLGRTIQWYYTGCHGIISTCAE